MCLSIFLVFLDSLPFIWLITMPIYGSFCGTDAVLRLSLLMQLHSAITKLFPQGLAAAIPFFKVILLLSLLALPVSLTPYPLVWMYDKVLCLSEPLWLCMEAGVMVLVIMQWSQWSIRKMEEEPDYSGWIKAFVLGVCSLCYIFLAVCFKTMFSEGSHTPTWLLIFLVTLCVLVHVAMWISDEGVILDAAFLSLCGAAVLYIGKTEIDQSAQPLTQPESWEIFGKDVSFLRLFFSFAGASMQNTSRAVSFVRKLFSPLFLLFTAVRLYSVLAFCDVLLNRDENQEDDMFGDEEDKSSYTHYVTAWKQPLTVRLAVIFVYTQVVIHHIHNSTIDEDSSFLSYINPVYQLPGRTLQMIFIFGLYLYRLYVERNNESW